MNHLESAIGYQFRDPELLKTALRHSSYANEHRGLPDNERLEFLGDAVLELSSSHYLYTRHPEDAEGDLSKKRSSLVCEASLAACARRIGLGDELMLGRGEEKSGGRTRDSLLSDAFEAVIGAIYLDGGFEAARLFVYNHVMREREDSPAVYDAKTILQEVLQKDGEISIVYRQKESSGPDHERLFTAEVEVNGKVFGEGSGRSKKLAEQAAALMALRKLQADGACSAGKENVCI